MSQKALQEIGIIQNRKHEIITLSGNAVRRLERKQRRAKGKKMLREIRNTYRAKKRAALGNFPDEQAWQKARSTFVYRVILAGSYEQFQKAKKDLARFEREKHMRVLHPPKGRKMSKGWLRDELTALAIHCMWNKGGKQASERRRAT